MVIDKLYGGIVNIMFIKFVKDIKLCCFVKKVGVSVCVVCVNECVREIECVSMNVYVCMYASVSVYVSRRG